MAEWSSGNRYLSQEEMEYNAQLVQAYGLNAGWSKNAICAILGNMESESGINPGIWESLTPWRGGYGLTQWTPYTKYSQWAGVGWQNNGDKEMDRIAWEAANDEQWFYNSQIGEYPPYDFSDFLRDSTTTIATMANYFLWFYEHPANPIQPWRGEQALAWESFLDWDDPPEPPPVPPEPPEPPEPEFPYWLLFKFRGRGLH